MVRVVPVRAGEDAGDGAAGDRDGVPLHGLSEADERRVFIDTHVADGRLCS